MTESEVKMKLFHVIHEIYIYINIVEKGGRTRWIIRARKVKIIQRESQLPILGTVFRILLLNLTFIT